MSVTHELLSPDRDARLNHEVAMRDFETHPVTREESLDPAFRQALVRSATGLISLQKRLDANAQAGFGPQAPAYGSRRPLSRAEVIY